MNGTSKALSVHTKIFVPQSAHLWPHFSSVQQSNITYKLTVFGSRPGCEGASSTDPPPNAAHTCPATDIRAIFLLRQQLTAYQKAASPCEPLSINVCWPCCAPGPTAGTPFSCSDTLTQSQMLLTKTLILVKEPREQMCHSHPQSLRNDTWAVLVKFRFSHEVASIHKIQIFISVPVFGTRFVE